MVDCIGTRLVRSRDGSHGDIDCVYMRLIIGFEVEYDQYSDSAKSCKRVHIPNIAIIGFGNIPNELARICLFESEYWCMYTPESEYGEVEAKKRNWT